MSKSTGTSRTAAPAVRTQTYEAAPRRREFVITVVDENDHRQSGFGLTLDMVLESLLRTFRSITEDGVTKGSPADPREYYDDHVIWEGNRVLAVVRVDREGTGLEVTRFDGPAAD